MKRLAISWGAFAVLATIALLLARLFEPGRSELELDVFLLAVGGAALLNVVILIRESYPLERPVTQIARALERDDPEPAAPAGAGTGRARADDGDGDVLRPAHALSPARP